MPRRETTPRPTDAEHAILRVLWAEGPQTVRVVHERLGRGTGYTTVLKLLQIMTEKGLVDRDESRRSHVYRARPTEADVQDRLVSDLAARAFGGSAAQLAMRALSEKPASKDELDEVRALLKRLAADEEGER